MHLLIIVLNHIEKLEELLEGFIELEIPGATILDSVGMGSVLDREVPIFAGFRSMFAGNQPNSKVLLSIIRDDDKLEVALDFVDRLLNVEGSPGGAFSIVVPVAQVRGARIRYKADDQG
jgi:nitrogen regulatory protein P-II 1